MSGESDTEASQGRQQNGEPPQEQRGGRPAQPQQQEQPPQGQPPEGQPPREGQSRQQPPRAASEPEPLKEWTVYGTALFAVAGAGLGLLTFLLDAIDEPIFSVDGGGFGADISGASMFTELFVMVAAMVAIFTATFVGVALSRHLSFPDDETMKIAGAIGAAGALAVLLLASIFNLLAIDNVSLEVGGLLINGVVAGLLGGATGAGGVWLDRNQAPSVE